MSIFGGQRVGGAKLVKGLIPYSESFSVTLNGTNWVTVKNFGVSVQLKEILVKIPTLASASNIYLAIFDPDFQTDGDERWNSGTEAETSTVDLVVDRLLLPETLLKIKADATATETVTGVIYGIL